MNHCERLTSALQSGDYLATYDNTPDPDPGSRCGYSDSELHAISFALQKRGLDLMADDIGLRVVPLATALPERPKHDSD